MDDDYQFEDVDSTSAPQKQDSESTSQGQGGGYADELFSKQIKAKFRTFFVDLKESQNGKFIKRNPNGTKLT